MDKNIENYLDEKMQDINIRMNELVNGTNKTLNKMCEWLLSNRGKQLRPRFMLAASLYFEQQPDITEYAAIIELFHMATLVHDDVIDNSNYRRGRISVNKKYGLKNAVYLGDYIIFSILKNMDYNLIKRNIGQDVFMNGISKICDGEIGQNNHLFDCSITKEDYLTNIEGKTAALFEMAYKCPAIVYEADNEIADYFGNAGRAYGMLFQINDDLKDIYSKTSEIGKPIFQDITNGVYTLPIILAFENEQYGKELMEICSQSQKNYSIQNYSKKIMEIIKFTYSLSKTYDIAMLFYEQGMEALEHLNKNDVTDYFKIQLEQVFKSISEMCNI